MESFFNISAGRGAARRGKIAALEAKKGDHAAGAARKVPLGRVSKGIMRPAAGVVNTTKVPCSKVGGNTAFHAYTLCLCQEHGFPRLIAAQGESIM